RGLVHGGGAAAAGVLYQRNAKAHIDCVLYRGRDAGLGPYANDEQPFDPARPEQLRHIGLGERAGIRLDQHRLLAHWAYFRAYGGEWIIDIAEGRRSVRHGRVERPSWL